MTPTDPDPRQAAAALLLVALLTAALLAALLSRPSRKDGLRATAPITYRIDPNAADRDTLCLLPGVGPPTAQTLIDDRLARGPFRSPGDLERVPGIGPKTAAAITPWVRLSAPDPAPGPR